MDANKQRDPMPDEFESIEAAAEFWDAHSLADYEDQLHEVEIDVHAQRRAHLHQRLFEGVCRRMSD